MTTTLTQTYDAGTCDFCHKPITSTNRRVARFRIKRYCDADCRTNAFVRRRFMELFPELEPVISNAMDSILDGRVG